VTPNPGRILTTHVGSLPRPLNVVELLFAQDRGEPFDPDSFDSTIRLAVAEAVAKQLEAGIDIPSDGEMSKIGYGTYIRHRLSGFEGEGAQPRDAPADIALFPEFKDHLVRQGFGPAYFRPVCRGPVAPISTAPLERDIENLRGALRNNHGGEAFMNAASPGVVASFQPNEYYSTQDDYLEAISEAMKSEYDAIVRAGFLLQVDCPDLAMERHITFRSDSDAEFLGRVEQHIAVLNSALRDIPAERVRMHICWGNYVGPHVLDIPLAKIVRAVLKAKPSGLLLEAANPRHAHEWIVWNHVSLPDEKYLVPGVIDSTTNFVEHPELVADRIVRFAEIVGRERVVAGTDCGFGTIAGSGAVHPTICWPKLRALTEGARLATERLW
jgi:5-methyltetrahydropteroyltriglutamate--homocysteine methyltransferase